jgi:putative ABC transport system permease protein
MLHASWKSLLGRKLRLFMSAFAIILGVAFVAGSLIFTDTLNKAFVGITSTVGDVVVRPEGTGGADGTTTSKTIPASVVAQLARIPGVARADGNIVDPTTFVVSKQGKVIGGQGAPGLGLNHTGGPTASGEPPATIVDGRWPQRSGEIAIDSGTAKRADYVVGDTATLVTSGAQATVKAKVVGLVKFGPGGTIGATLTFFDTATAQRLYQHGKDVFTDVWVTAADGTSQEDLRAAVAAKLPKGLEAVTGDAAAAEAQDQIGQVTNFIGIFLLVFAGIAVVVGSFLIMNTFSILVAQRSRELALLRALGARRRQVSRSVLFEAFVIALFGSTVGVGVGFLLAVGIRALFGTFGLDLSSSPLVFQSTTVLAAYAVGLVVTLVAAYLPARRAGKMPPVAAMRDDVAMPERSLQWRALAGATMQVLGVYAVVLGVFTQISHGTYWIGGGVFGLVIGTSLISPVIGRPLIAVVGWVYRLVFGTVGVMAEQNAVRNPRRTAATASALMIGLTLVAMMSVFGASAKASVDQTIKKNFTADYVVSNAIGQPFAASITQQVRKVAGVKTVSSFRFLPLGFKDGPSFAGAVDPATFPQAVSMDMLAGSVSALAQPNTIIVDDARASENGYRMGDRIQASIAGVDTRLKVVGIYASRSSTPAGYLVSLATATKAGLPQRDSMMFVLRQPGADPAAVSTAINRIIADIPTVTLKDQNAFAAERRAPIDQMLYIIYALLGLAVVIAVLGIINTLALSVIERTREIGLLRAVGLSRRQLRAMLRLESVVIALLGAVLGIVLGLGAGVALQRSLVDDGIRVLSIPYPQLALFTALAAVVGVLAAVWPGRRAARLDVLRAISME